MQRAQTSARELGYSDALSSGVSPGRRLTDAGRPAGAAGRRVATSGLSDQRPPQPRRPPDHPKAGSRPRRSTGLSLENGLFSPSGSPRPAGHVNPRRAPPCRRRPEQFGAAPMCPHGGGQQGARPRGAALVPRDPRFSPDPPADRCRAPRRRPAPSAGRSSTGQRQPERIGEPGAGQTDIAEEVAEPRLQLSKMFGVVEPGAMARARELGLRLGPDDRRGGPERRGNAAGRPAWKRGPPPHAAAARASQPRPATSARSPSRAAEFRALEDVATVAADAAVRVPPSASVSPSPTPDDRLADHRRAGPMLDRRRGFHCRQQRRATRSSMVSHQALILRSVEVQEQQQRAFRGRPSLMQMASIGCACRTAPPHFPRRPAGRCELKTGG